MSKEFMLNVNLFCLIVIFGRTEYKLTKLNYRNGIRLEEGKM